MRTYAMTYMNKADAQLAWLGAAILAASGFCPCLSNVVLAQQYPEKPIRLIVPVPPGGGADFVARTYAARLSEAFGQQIVVDNRGGAAGIIAMEAVAKAPPDGYTLIQTNISTLSINPFMYKNMGFDPAKDLAPITNVASGPQVIVIGNDVAAKDLK